MHSFATLGFIGSQPTSLPQWYISRPAVGLIMGRSLVDQEVIFIYYIEKKSLVKRKKIVAKKMPGSLAGILAALTKKNPLRDIAQGIKIKWVIVKY